ncbi:MAG: Rpp14/Pop5 family protein [Candidatus Nanohaloarchaea archaeon]
MGDLKTLPSSLRGKKRYIVFEILAERNREIGQVVDEFWDAMLEFLGQEGVSRAEPWILGDLFDEERQRGGVKVDKDMVEEVRAALALVTDIDGEDATVQVLGVTGTMDSAREKYF